MFTELPPRAAWRHQDARDGFETVFFTPSGGYELEGCTAAVEFGEAWFVQYAISVDVDWRTTSARVRGRSRLGEHEVRITGDGNGHWHINGVPAPELDGCLDVDLESSACTNAAPVHRLGLPIGAGADAPAVYVRELDLRVERLEQQYLRIADDGARQRFDYRSPGFDFACELAYDEAGLVLEYPGIATRVL
jgi:uncharacterized protein